MSNYTFTAWVRVWDPRQLHQAALARYRDDCDPADGAIDVFLASAEDLLGAADDPNIANCIGMLLDPGSMPGCTIEESKVEADEEADIDLEMPSDGDLETGDDKS